MRVDPLIIEKDFWVCWTLRQLFSLPELGTHLIFKGGTSLSKAYHAIERFSEDIDLSIEREVLGFGGIKSPEAATGNERKRRLIALAAACEKTVVERVLPGFVTATKGRLRNGDWSVEIDSEDPQTLHFRYPSCLPGSGASYVVRVVKIETGARSDHFPCESRVVKPYVAEHFPNGFAETDTSVRVLTAERTFWEKATLLHAYCHYPDEKQLPPRLSRHYYDVSCLIRAGIGAKAAADRGLLSRVVEHKSVFYRSGWANYETANKGNLRLTPSAERLPEWRVDYAKMQIMFFGEQPAFDLVLKDVTRFETRFNSEQEELIDSS